jgi:hypothetical protein
MGNRTHYQTVLLFACLISVSLQEDFYIMQQDGGIFSADVCACV